MTDHALTIGTRQQMQNHLRAATIASAEASLEILRSHQPLESDEQASAVADLAKACRAARLEIKSQADTILEPLKQATAAVNALVKPKLEAFQQGEDQAKTLVGAWNRLKERRHAEALEAANAAQGPPTDGPPEASEWTPPPSTISRGGAGKMHETSVAKVRIVDKAAAMRARADLFDLRNADAIRALKAGPVPGLELYYEKVQVLS